MTESSQGNSSPETQSDELSRVEGASAAATSATVQTAGNDDELPRNAGSERPPVPSSQAKVRRSSLRPAPADYRPSVRDPSSMRPMMIVRAGDAETNADPVDSGDRASLTQPLPDSTNQEDAFAAARQSASGVLEEEPALAIPHAPAVPIDLVPKSTRPGRGTAESSASRLEALVPTANPNTADKAGSTAKPKTTSRSPIAIAVVAISLAAIVLVLKHGASDRSSPTKPAPAPVAQPAAAVEQPARAEASQKPSATEHPAVESAPAVSASAAAAQRVVPEIASAAPAEERLAPTPAPGMTRVRLDLKPIDAKVYMRGREIPGPPYEFDIAKGERVAVEVVRFGFVTAKVVLDDKKPVVSFGMLRERWKR